MTIRTVLRLLFGQKSKTTLKKIKPKRSYVYRGTDEQGNLLLSTYEEKEESTWGSSPYWEKKPKVITGQQNVYLKPKFVKGYSSEMILGRIYEFRFQGDELIVIGVTQDAFASAAGIDCPVFVGPHIVH